MGEKRGISGNAWKIIACISMFIDHIGACLLENGVFHDTETYKKAMAFLPINWLVLDNALRIIGRAAFPIFALMLVEGFVHTRSVKKYALRLAIFGILSEIPFDLAFNGAVLEFEYQNVFLTLLISLVSMVVIHRFHNTIPAFLATTVVACALGYFTRCDYGAIGVGFILLVYFMRTYREKRENQEGVFEGWLYNGKRGEKNLRLFFYCFYPLHLLFFVGVRYLWFGLWK